MFKNIKIGARLITGFLTIACLLAVVCVFSYRGLSDLLDPLAKEIPAELKAIEITSRLDSLAQRTRYFDRELTESAREYALKGDAKWKYRYRNIEPQLEDAIKESIRLGDSLGDDKVARFFSDVLKAKMAFVETEKASMAARDQGLIQKSVSLLESADYWKLKEEYKQGLEAYVESRGKKLGETLEVSTGKVKTVVRKTHDTVEDSLHFILIVSILSFLLAVVLGLVVSGSIVKPITQLRRGAEIIGKGVLDYRIGIESRDEIGALAATFNDMTRKLKESYTGLEDKVREKTKELAAKILEIEQAKAKDEAILSSIGDGMVATDERGRVMLLNRPAEVMFGIKADAVLGKLFIEAIRAEDEEGKPILAASRPMHLALTEGKKITAVAYYERADKTKFPAAVTVSPILRAGSAVGAIQIFRDITREKEMENMKTEFVQTVSHELRTPLTTIREGVSQVLDGILGETTPEQKEFLAISMDDIDRLRRIIDNLLDISKIEAGKFELRKERVDVARVAHGVTCTFAPRFRAKGLKINALVPETPIYAYADKDKLIQIFTNLIGNALKFTETGHIDVAVKEKDGMVECSVADTGKGIAEEDLHKVFGKFQQFGREHGGGEKGTGLGLSISKGIVELHQGKIWVESKLGEGTSFLFTLEAYSPEAAIADRVNSFIKQAVKKGKPFSVFAFELKDAGVLEKKLGSDKIAAAVKKWEQGIRASGLIDPEDKIAASPEALFTMLHGRSKEKAVPIAERITEESVKLLRNAGLNGRTELIIRVAGYPEDGSGINDIIAALRACRPIQKAIGS